MKRTEFSVMTSWGMNNYNGTWKRVYIDKNGKRYIRENGEYKSIENNKALLDTMTRA